FGFATVRTDKDDYAPGTTVKITGGGWKPHESVALILRESPFFDEHPLLNVEADDNGNIVSTEFAPDEHDIGIRFYLTAYGEASQARTTFTDANNENTSMTVSCSASSLPVGSVTTCTATVNNIQSPATNGYPQGSAAFTVNGGLIGSFSPASCT